MSEKCFKCHHSRGNLCLEGVPEDKKAGCNVPEIEEKKIRNAALDKAAEWISDFPFLSLDQGELRSMIERMAGDRDAVRVIRDRLYLECLCPVCGETVELEAGSRGDCPFCEGFLGEAEVNVINGR